MTRKRFTERHVIMTLIEQGARIPCGICGIAIKFADAFEKKVQRDHTIPLWLGGADDWTNCKFVHDVCHKRKTDGSKATSYGSDKHESAKAKRIRGETKTRPKRKIRSRGFSKAPANCDPWTRRIKNRY